MRVMFLGGIGLGRINRVRLIPVFCDSKIKCLFVDNHSEEKRSKILDILYKRKVYHTKYCLQTLYERFKSFINYKYTEKQLVNHDNILKSNNSCIIEYPITNILAMPKSTDFTFLSLDSKCNSLFSNCADNNWKHLSISLLNPANSTLQMGLFYRILSVILGIRVPHLLLKLRSYQISRCTKRFDLLSPHLVKPICYT